jgi:hypothetical protein
MYIDRPTAWNQNVTLGAIDVNIQHGFTRVAFWQFNRPAPNIGGIGKEEHAMSLVYIAVAFFVLLCACLSWTTFRVSSLRRQGLYPPKGRITMEEVRHLALGGERILAMRAYREMSGASLKNAKKVVENIVASGSKIDL